MLSAANLTWTGVGSNVGLCDETPETNGRDHSGFDGLDIACWPLVPKFAGSHPAEAVGFLGRKNPQHAFLRRGSKAVGPMS